MQLSPVQQCRRIICQEKIIWQEKTRYTIHDTWYTMHDTQYRQHNAKYTCPVQSSGMIQDTGYKLHGTWYMVHATYYMVIHYITYLMHCSTNHTSRANIWHGQKIHDTQVQCNHVARQKIHDTHLSNALLQCTASKFMGYPHSPVLPDLVIDM